VPFVPAERHQFTIVPARPRPSWHARSSRNANVGDWLQTWSQASAAWRASRGGVITVFPQLAFAAGMQQRVRFRERPLVAWCFNLGALYDGAKRRASQLALAGVDRFIVHSSAEAARYAEWLELPRERFRFVPLQRGAIPIVEREDEERPFVLALGSARRDYATLFEAVRRSGYSTLVVAARHAVDGLDVPANVELRSGLTEEECHHLAQRARVNVVPVMNHETASGQVTLLETMRMGRAVVATRCIGSEDYVKPESTGLLVEAGSVDELQRAIERLWDDRALRQELGANAARYTAEHCSDEAAGIALERVLDEVRDERLR
jgi:glycosyltransferase involved in cell wall biosynthesis